MADLSYPTNLDLGGPWLVTREQLEALEEIVSREFSDLNGSLESRLEKDVDSEIERYHSERSAEWKEKKRQELRVSMRGTWGYKVERKIELLLSGGKRLNASTFKEATAHPELSNTRIGGITLALHVGETKCSLELGGWRESLRLSVSGENQTEREKLFIALRNWVADIQAPAWLRAWGWVAATQFQWFVWFSLLVPSALFLSFTESQESPYTDIAHKLLAKGLDPKDSTKALEAILALESNYKPNIHSPGVPFWFWAVLIGGPLFCIFLSIRPRIEIGVGAGAARLRRWNLWTRFFAITAPFFIFATIARSIILNVLGKL